MDIHLIVINVMFRHEVIVRKLVFIVVLSNISSKRTFFEYVRGRYQVSLTNKIM